MTNQFDELSKSLAAGISRRKAARSFLAGLGGVAFGAFSAKSAFADSTSCQTWCASQAAQFQALCLSASANCPDLLCASILPTLASSVVAAAPGTAAPGTTVVGLGAGSTTGLTTAVPVTATGPVSINGTTVNPLTGTKTLPATTTGTTINGTSISAPSLGTLAPPPVPQYCVMVAGASAIKV